jgi:hypothetical protein
VKFIGMILGGILSGLGHGIAFVLKNIFIAIRRFSMDPANKNAIWNMQAFGILSFLILLFLWLVGRYQDILYGISEPVFYRAIPLLLPCFLGHLIYSCPVLFKNSYAKPIIQTFLNAFSIMALGQIILKYTPLRIGLLVDALLLVGTVALTLYYTLHLNVRSTIFNKLIRVVEEAEIQESDKKKIRNKSQANIAKNGVSQDELLQIDRIDLNQKGCLNHLRYYSEDCKLELFNTVPTKDRQSELKVLSRSDRAQHAQIIGGTGAGKTLLATNLIAQDLLNDYIGSTIIEPKGSLINRLSNFMDRTGRNYRRLDPEYEFTDCLNPFYVPEGQDIEPMVEANVSAFHGYLGPDAEQYFKSRSTQLLRVGIKALKMAYGNECTYNELNKLIQPLNDEFRAEVLSELRGRESEVPLLLEYTRNMAGTSKMQEHAMQTYSNLYDYLSELTSNKYIQRIFCGPSTFNIDDALHNGEVVLVNGAYGTLQTLTYTVGRLYINLLRASTFRRNLKEKVRPHQLTVDEIEMFADEEFSTFLEMAREFELFVNVIHQGNVQLDDVSERLGTMVKQNAVQKFIMAGLDNDDAEYYADMIGEEYKIGISSGTDEMSTTGFKTQIKEEKRYTVLPSEILKLKGYNVATGEPAECLFRGVQNNVRMDPVIGHVYPLPRKLFEPIGEVVEEIPTAIPNEDSNVEEQEQPPEDSTKNQREIDKTERQKSLLDAIRSKNKKEQDREGEVETGTDINHQTQNNGKATIRNSTWDMPKEGEVAVTSETALEASVATVGQQGGIMPSKGVEKSITGTDSISSSGSAPQEGTKPKWQPAQPGEMGQLQERLAKMAEEERKKGASEAE